MPPVSSHRRSRRRAVAGSVLLAAFLLSACGGGGGGGIGVAGGLNVVRVPVERRDQGPRFTGPILAPGDGATISQAAYAGKVAVVNFWGSWCGPCRREQPSLNALWRQYSPRGVYFLGVNVKDPKSNALAYREEFSVPYESVFSPNASVAHAFRVRLMPSTFVLDRDGRIAARIVGALRDEDDLREILEQELGEGMAR